ncbi:MAG: type II toxin-antitoxin system PemK/MazF family toxin [Candidatus Cloacimonadota bacterium]|nr:type II toxin-antitoxin system PemK/MazF family toxin [Candidatus Cloacimonadota bacterium]
MNRGEIWLINLEPTLGKEIKKTRPTVIVNDDAIGILPLRVIVPITEWKERYSIAPWMVKLTPDSKNNLEKISSADCFQVRSVSKERFVKKIGALSADIMKKITNALALVLAIEQ